MSFDKELATGLEGQDRKEVVTSLNRLLADEYILCKKTRSFHWNVTGPTNPTVTAPRLNTTAVPGDARSNMWNRI